MKIPKEFLHVESMTELWENRPIELYQFFRNFVMIAMNFLKICRRHLPYEIILPEYDNLLIILRIMTNETSVPNNFHFLCDSVKGTSKRMSSMKQQVMK